MGTLNFNFKGKITSNEICSSVDDFSNITDKLQIIFKEKKFSDITLVSKNDGHQIEAHKVILCAASEYFLAMFGGCMREAKENRVELQIDGPTLESVIDFIYSSSIELTSENVEDILTTANLFQLKQLKTLCVEFIANQIDVTNCFGIHLFAEHYNLNELCKTSEEFVCDWIEDIVKYDEFFKIDACQLGKILSSDRLRVRSEENVFQILISWINHDRLNRKMLFEKLLHHIRFPLLDDKFITNKIEPLCKRFRSSLDTKNSLTKPRNFNNLMVFSGLDIEGSNLTIILYDSSLQEWCHKTDIPGLENYRVDFGCISFEGKLIIVGGKSDGVISGRVDCLNLRTFKWTSLSPLNVERAGCKIVSLKGYIYAIGGYSKGLLKTVERYDQSKQKWDFVAPMIGEFNKRSVIISASTSFNKIFVCIRDQVYYVSEGFIINYYDPITDTWTDRWLIISEFAAKYSVYDVVGTGMISRLNNHIFVILYRDRMEQYNVFKPSKFSKRFDRSMDSNCNSCIIFRNRILAYGHDVIQEYNPLINTWTFLPHFGKTLPNYTLVNY